MMTHPEAWNTDLAATLLIAQPRDAAQLLPLIEGLNSSAQTYADPDVALADLTAWTPDLVILHSAGIAITAVCAQFIAATSAPLLVLLEDTQVDDVDALLAAGAIDILLLPTHTTLLKQRIAHLFERCQLMRAAADAEIARQKLAQSEERYRIISSVISDYAYAYAVTEDGGLEKEWVTNAFSRIIGFDPENARDEGFVKFIHPEDLDIAGARAVKLLSGEPDVSEFRIITNRGDVRWIRDHGYPVIDPDSGRVIRLFGAAQDITLRREQEEVLRQHAEALQARNRELDAFAYTVAHDLKNPLANIMGFASVVDTYYDRMDKADIKENMQAIMEGIYRMRSIINGLLLLAGVNKMEKLTLQPLDMAAIVEGMQRNLHYLIAENSAEIIHPETWYSATGYPAWIEEVWANYVSNAIKYGGRPPRIELGADQPENGTVRYWVRDNGKGLTPEEQAQLFTPFTRLSQVTIEGHGLGLSVVQRIIERLGGAVGVESEIGVGSRFWFTLPANSPQRNGSAGTQLTGVAIGQSS